jgi:hypothetical protein
VLLRLANVFTVLGLQPREHLTHPADAQHDWLLTPTAATATGLVTAIPVLDQELVFHVAARRLNSLARKQALPAAG